MTGPARSGVLFYAKDMQRLCAFYVAVLDARVVHADQQHCVLQSADVQLIIHAIPAPYRDEIEISVPPIPREEQAIKPFFTVPGLQDAENTALRFGGMVLGQVYTGPGILVRNVCDPEGNILHLRESTA